MMYVCVSVADRDIQHLCTSNGNYLKFGMKNSNNLKNCSNCKGNISHSTEAQVVIFFFNCHKANSSLTSNYKLESEECICLIFWKTHVLNNYF